MAPKVLIISSYSGSKTSVRPEAEMVLRLKQAGVHVDLMSAGDGPYADTFREHGIHIYPFRSRKKFSRQEIRYIRKTLQQGRYDVVHAFNNRVVPNTVLAAWDLPVRVVTYRGYTGHLVWYKPTAWLSHLNPQVSRITCVSEGVTRQVRRQLLFNRDKAVTIYKGHDPQWYSDVKPYTRKELGLPEDAFVVGCVANARPMKGIPYLIKASWHLGHHPNIHFMLIGKNMDSRRHTDLIARSPLRQHFHLPGFQRDVLNHLAACDVMVLPSIRGEGLSKVTIEAMSTGMPVIATDVGGNAELVLHKKTGWLVPRKSPEKIAEGIEYLHNNPQSAREMGQKGRQHIRENFHIDQTVQQMKDLYENLVP